MINQIRVVLLGLALIGWSAAAQEFPSRAVRLLSPFPAESLLEASELLPVPFPALDPASDLASDFSPLEAFPAPSPLSDDEDCDAPPFLA